MAIIVSNPTTVQFSGAVTESQDPTATTPVAGFTEELANAMQPPAQATETAEIPQKPLGPVGDSKVNDLQILPADVLLNAVGEANFAFVTQGSQAGAAPDLAQKLELAADQTTQQDSVDPAQAAEMAAAQLAAQMASQLPNVNVNLSPAQAVKLEQGMGTGELAQVASSAAGSEGASLQNLVQANGVTPQVSQSPEVDAQTLGVTAFSTSEQQTQDQALGSLTPNAPIDTNLVGNQNLANPMITALGGQAQTSAQKPLTVVTEETVSSAQKLQFDNSLNQAADNAVPNLQINSQIDRGSSGLDATLSNSSAIPLVQAEIATDSDTSTKFDVTDAASQAAIGQQTEFDLAKSDVARPSDIDSANLLPTGISTRTDEEVLVSSSSSDELLKTDVSEFNVLPQTERNDVFTESVSNDLTGKAIQTPLAEVSQESSFKFDAKLGTKPAVLDVAQITNPLKSSIPVSLGGGEQATAQPVSLGASLAPVALKPQIVQSQVHVESEAIVTTQALTTPSGQEVILESAVQTTTVTTIEQSGQTPVNQQSASTSTLVQTIEQPVSNTELVVKKSVQIAQSSQALTTSTAVTNQSREASDLEVSTDAIEDVAVQKEQISSTMTPLVTTRAEHAAHKEPHTSNFDSIDPVDASAALNINRQSVNLEASASGPQSDVQQSKTQGFNDVSSTFVSSLVGGAPKPVTTVMDWVALKPQEPPRPVMPHELRLDAGAVQVEIQRMVKQGGGHVVMELTPPDQSKFTIELKLDDKGGAYLKVEGVSDSTKTRLEQSAPQLQEQFQQMGLNLQLDMRQNRDPSTSSTADWTPNEPSGNNQLPQETNPQTPRAVAAERARKNSGSQVYLYA